MADFKPIPKPQVSSQFVAFVLALFGLLAWWLGQCSEVMLERCAMNVCAAIWFSAAFVVDAIGKVRR